MSNGASAQPNVVLSLSSPEQYRARMFGDVRRCACNNQGMCVKGNACYYKKAKSALKRAHDIRKFEIELLWKRAAYVATFQTLLFAAMGLSFRAQHNDLVPLFQIVTCIAGVFSSFFWCLINWGSKFWHENWEKHIDFLEDDFDGKLHKTILHKDGRKSYSVSRVNICISITFLVTWWILAAVVLCDLLEKFYCVSSCFHMKEIAPFVFLVLIPALLFLFLYCGLKTKFRGVDTKSFSVNKELPKQILPSTL